MTHINGYTTDLPRMSSNGPRFHAKSDRSLVELALAQNGSMLAFVPAEMRGDVGIVSTAVSAPVAILMGGEYSNGAFSDAQGLFIECYIDHSMRQFLGLPHREHRYTVGARDHKQDGFHDRGPRFSRYDDHHYHGLSHRDLVYQYHHHWNEHWDALGDVHEATKRDFIDRGGLAYASDSARSDRAIVMLAVRTHGPALEYATDKLRDDPEVCLAAMASNIGCGTRSRALALSCSRALAL